MKLFYLRKNYLLVILAILGTFTACESTDDEDEDIITYNEGVLISNEGPFDGGAGTGSISFFNKVESSIENNVFETVNNRPLGNVVQSVSLHNDNTYIVVNNANVVEVVEAETFKSTGVIEGLALPRYFMGIDNNKAYVSQWGEGGVAGSIAVIDLTTNTITKTIATDAGAEHMLRVGNEVWVACSGGFGSANSIEVINTESDELTQSITVGFNPNSLQLDANNKVWAVCNGNTVYDADWNVDEAASTVGSLSRIDAATYDLESNLAFGSIYGSPSNLVINSENNMLYYIYNGKVFQHDIDASSLNETAFIAKSFYGLGFDSEGNYLFATDAKDFISRGYVFRYNAATAAIVDSMQAGVIPNDGFSF
ncbi:MAG: DUF5074 domain-containing protein [Chitinophagales bacterium]